MDRTDALSKRIISVTELRRNFGAITTKLAEVESLIITRGGEPFAILKAAPEEKMKILEETAGAWKRTALDDDSLWNKILT